MATINNGGRISAQDLTNLIVIVQNANLFGLNQEEFREITAVIRNQALITARITENPNLQVDMVRPEIPDEIARQKLEHRVGVFDSARSEIDELEEGHGKLHF